jgi:hypothetical protein
MANTYSYITLKALINSPALNATTTYQLLTATLITGHFVDFINLADTLTSSDQQVVAFGKYLDDVFSVSDSASLSTGKSLTDSITLADVLSLLTTLSKAETVTASDAKVIAFTGSQSDTVTGADSITSIAFTKFLADTLTTVDSLAITSGDVEQDAVAIDDIGALDHPVMNIGKILADTTTSSDSGVLFIQDYSDITYFLEDYVGVSRTF